MTGRHVTVEFDYQGQSHKFDLTTELASGDLEDPHDLMKAMDRAPGLYAWVATVQLDSKTELGFARIAREAAEATLKQAIKKAGESKAVGPGEKFSKIALTEIDRRFQQALDYYSRFVDPTIQDVGDDSAISPYFEELDRYAKLKAKENEWSKDTEKLAVIVETIRIHCTMLRVRAPLLGAMLQQNLIQPKAPKTGDNGTLHVD